MASANKLLKMSGLTDDIVSLAEITPSMIYMIFETAFGSLPEGTIRVPTCQYDDEMNVELILKVFQIVSNIQSDFFLSLSSLTVTR